MREAIVSDSVPGGNSCPTPISPPNTAAAAYAFLQHRDYMLDELSLQGLVLWMDNAHRW
jgi:hypothetical protein